MTASLRLPALVTALLALAGCSTLSRSPATPADIFFGRLSDLCGHSYAGNLAAGNDSDAAFANAALRAHVRECSEDEVRIAFEVGTDRSRTWIVTRTATGLRLKHRHLHDDGTEDDLSQYGGDTVTEGGAARQAFPVDAFSQALFTRTGRAVSNTNVWALEVERGVILTYELARPGRLFRVSFDLSRPLP